jgi:hypothetical protein
LLSLLWFWRRAILRVVLMMALAALGVFAAVTLIEIPLAPWVRSFGLWPTLTGDWYGTLETTDRSVSYVYFEIRGQVLGRQRGPNIRGTARWCDRTGQIWDYDIWGDPDNWRGTQFHLSTRNEIERDSGVDLGDLQGEWNGDAIRAISALVPRARTATAEATRSSRSSTERPIARLSLQRGAERDFLAACANR